MLHLTGKRCALALMVLALLPWPRALLTLPAMHDADGLPRSLEIKAALLDLACSPAPPEYKVRRVHDTSPDWVQHLPRLTARVRPPATRLLCIVPPPAGADPLGLALCRLQI